MVPGLASPVRGEPAVSEGLFSVNYKLGTAATKDMFGKDAVHMAAIIAMRDEKPRRILARRLRTRRRYDLVDTACRAGGAFRVCHEMFSLVRAANRQESAAGAHYNPPGRKSLVRYGLSLMLGKLMRCQSMRGQRRSTTSLDTLSAAPTGQCRFGARISCRTMF